MVQDQFALSRILGSGTEVCSLNNLLFLKGKNSKINQNEAESKRKKNVEHSCVVRGKHKEDGILICNIILFEIIICFSI